MSWSQKLGGRGGNSSSNNNTNKILSDDAPSLPSTSFGTNTNKNNNNKQGSSSNTNNNQQQNLSKAWANNKLVPKQQQQDETQQQQQSTKNTTSSPAAASTASSSPASSLPVPRSQQPSQQQQRHQIDYYVVLDFEATCDRDRNKCRPQEIIEFPSVIVDANRAIQVAEFQRYVRPVHHPKLSDFCTGLTGIPQKAVDEADTFAVVWQQYMKWLSDCGLTQPEASGRVAWVTCGDWDLKTMTFLLLLLLYLERSCPSHYQMHHHC